jgi:hypothetical protein
MIDLPRAGRVGVTLLAAGLVAFVGDRTAGGQTVIDTTDAPRTLASNGAVVIMPEIEALDCAGMAQVLRRIDLSAYRGAEPVPRDHPDWPIFVYEDRVSRAYYRRCILADNRLADPGEAFSSGFEAQ